MLPAQTSEDLTGRLRAMTRDGGSIEAAQVKVIGLDEIREAAGPRWPRMRERVRTGSQAILAQHTGPDDVVIPAGDGFLVMLAEGRPGDTQRRCQQMRDALLTFYLGEEALAALRPEVSNRSLTPDSLTEFIASNMHEDKARFVAKAAHGEIALARVLLGQELKPGALLAAPVTRAGETRRICHNPDFILDGRHHLYRDFLELDIAILDAALERANQLQESGQTSAVGVCVHASTMQSRRSREAYLRWLEGIDPALRRTLFVAICEIERGTPLISITEWCVALRSQLSHVWLDFHYSDHAIGSIGSAGAWAAGFHLPAFAAAQRDRRAERLREQLGFWAKSVHGQGMRLVVHVYQDPDFLAEAPACGVDLLTSDNQWPFNEPGEPAREPAHAC
jgi:hypothetical protein